MTEQEKANQIAGSFYEGFKKGQEQGLIAGQQLSYMANYECEVFLGGLSDRRRIQSLTEQVAALTAERDALKAELDRINERAKGRQPYERSASKAEIEQLKGLPQKAEVEKPKFTLPDYDFTLDTDDMAERKRVFDTLKDAGVPIHELAENAGEAIDSHYPYLSCSDWEITQRTGPSENHYPPDQFLAQFGL